MNKPYKPRGDFKNSQKPRGFEDRGARQGGTEETRREAPMIEEPEDRLEGRNPVLEALKAGRTIDKIWVLKGEREGSIVRILSMARERNIVVQEVERQKLDAVSVTRAHQGIVAFVAVRDYFSIDEILQKAEEKGEKPFLLMVDEVTDPHNLGSLLRSAEACGVHGVIIPKRRSVGLTATVAKTSAGAIEYVPVCKVTNLAQTIDLLKEKNIWVMAADMDGRQEYTKADFDTPLCLVVGSEGEGIGALIKKKCDMLLSIPMKGKIGSLNASVAGAVMMFEVLRQRSQP